jgi:hypothetical protein
LLDIPGAPLLDKQRLIGGCTRLRLTVDADRLRSEVDALPAELWGSTGGRVGVHRAAEALFLRGYAPADGNQPVQDRDAFHRLPYARLIIEQLIPAPPQRCLLARLPPGAFIPAHVDRLPYFAKTLRLHIPVQSNADVHMICDDLTYSMRPGEIWALNNSTTHGVWNAHGTASRTHLICDFLGSQALLRLVSDGERELGAVRRDTLAQIGAQ